MKKANKLSLLLPLCLLGLSPLSAFGHVGVGPTSGFFAGVMHPLGGLDHMCAMFAVGLWAAQMGGRAIYYIPATFVSMMLVGGALGMTGIQPPLIEQGIVASVLFLGVLIAGAIRLPIVVSGLLVGLFAVCHGHAHGAEMPETMGALSYSLGFVFATASLHALGIAGGIALQKHNSENFTRLTGCAIALCGVYLAIPYLHNGIGLTGL